MVSNQPRKRLIAVTACPTGVAHTFLAAEALRAEASRQQVELRVETQGSMGVGDRLSASDIAGADAVIIAADTKVDLSRFAEKRVLIYSTKDAIRRPAELFRAAAGAPTNEFRRDLGVAMTASSRGASAAYKHLMTGVSFMLPVVTAGGLAIALAFAVGGVDAGSHTGSVGWALSKVGGAAMALMVPVLAGFIAYSIADRPALAPGFIGGVFAQEFGSGFLGGIGAGFLAGYMTAFLAGRIRLPGKLEAIKAVLVVPLVSAVGVGLLMIYVVAPPVHGILVTVTDWLEKLQTTNAVILGAILGGMMGFDLGGPLNKAAYTFAVGLLASQVLTPMAAVMAAGMVPPLGAAIATFLAPARFSEEECRSGAGALVLGLSFISEGAIPFAARDPLRVIPAFVAGSAVAGAITLAGGAQLRVPHGGVFAAFIPGALSGLPAFSLALVAGTLVTAGCLLFGRARLR